MRNVTIEDVANRCGVSRATVSRVINREGRVKPSTIRKVTEAIQELGYKPNVNAVALSGGKTKTVGVLLPGTWRDYYNPLLNGMDQVAARKGYYLLMRSKNYLTEAAHMADEGRADGFIIRNMADPAGHEKLFSALTKKGVPFILIGNALPDHPSIKIDNIGGARRLAHHFAEHKFRKILFIGGPESNIDSSDRFYGFKLGLSERGIDPAGLAATAGDYSTGSGYAALERVFHRVGPDAVFAANDRMALGALMYLRKIGVRVPGDIALAGFDDTFFAEHLSPSLTTVRQPIFEMGTIAMESIIQLLQGSPLGTQHIILPATLVVRGSCGCSEESFHARFPDEAVTG